MLLSVEIPQANKIRLQFVMILTLSVCSVEKAGNRVIASIPGLVIGLDTPRTDWA